MQYLTAYGALIDIAGLTKGDTVVIPAASSSVGLAAIQIANKVGAVPIALTRGSSKRQALLDAGAAHVIATDEQDLVKEILGITGGKGARVVFDPVGGPTVTKLAQATAHLGTLFLYGALSTEPTPLPLFDVLGKWLTIRGYVMMEITSDPEAAGTGEGIHQRRARRREPQADHRQDVPARGDRRGPPLPGVEPADRQGRRHGLRTGGILGWRITSSGRPETSSVEIEVDRDAPWKESVRLPGSVRRTPADPDGNLQRGRLTSARRVKREYAPRITGILYDESGLTSNCHCKARIRVHSCQSSLSRCRL